MTEQASQWLHFALDDLRMARLAHEEEIWTQVCFHGQQCVEKSLKAVLVDRQATVPRTHSIAELKLLIPASLLDGIEGDIGGFDDFYIPVRYPDMLPGSGVNSLPDQSDADEALALATAVFNQIQQYLLPGRDGKQSKAR